MAERIKKVTRQTLYMHTLGVVMRYYEYGSHDKKETKAIKALNKKFPSLSKLKCTNAFIKTLKLYEDSIVFVEKNVQLYQDKYRKRIKNKSYSHKELTFIEAHNTIPKSVIMATINWIFYWRHLR